MSIGLHDPRLTAYALGELTGPEKAEVEGALEKSEALREAVDEIRRTSEVIKAAFSQETPVGLNDEQIATITRAAETPRQPSRWWISAAGLSAAACILLAFFLTRPEITDTIWSVDKTNEDALAGSEAASIPYHAITPPKPSATGVGSHPSRAEGEFPSGNPRSGSPNDSTPPLKGESALAASDRPKSTTGLTKGGSPSETKARAALEVPTPIAPGMSNPVISTPSPNVTASPAATSALARGNQVSGEVIDASGAVLPGVTVELQRLVDGKVWTAVSGEDGSFKFSDLPSGPAELRASLEGFKTFSDRLQLKGTAQRVDAVLEVGQTTEMVTITEAAPMVSYEATTLPRAQPAKAQSLPMNARARGLLQLSPGVAPTAPADKEAEEEDDHNTEDYARVDDNPFRLVTQNPLSTFSIDVDTASYSNVRRFLNEGRLPPADAVRIEELVNYFSYDYPQPVGGHPFSVTTEAAEAPWNPRHLLVRIGLKGRELTQRDRPRSNLVFLIDVSGSMDEPNKLPLLVRAMKLLVDRLTSQDQVAIVVYAGSSGVALPSTPGNRKGVILEALDSLSAGGSTHGSAGIRKAYEIAADHFVKGGVNRVILATDGDFNVGTTSHGELTRLIEDQAKSGVFLSVLGFGMGNYKDSTLEALADKGNGNYGYIDTINEARKLLVEQMDGTLVTIAKDVKIQVEFNPAQVSGYRLIGYENRALRDEDFNDDTKDAGEIGAGHTVTALYELVPVGAPVDAATVDPLKYQRPTQVDSRFSHELLTVKLRYKRPEEEVSNLIETPVVDEGRNLANASDDFKFAAGVAAFGMVLRDSQERGNASFPLALELASQGIGPDRFGYRSEFLELVREAQRLAR